MKQIAIIIPTRERNHKIKKLHEQWFNMLDPNVSTDCVIVLDFGQLCLRLLAY
jgi:hypothetical protein